MPRADFYLIAKPRFIDDPLLLVCELAKRSFRLSEIFLVEEARLRKLRSEPVPAEAPPAADAAPAAPEVPAGE